MLPLPVFCLLGPDSSSMPTYIYLSTQEEEAERARRVESRHPERLCDYKYKVQPPPPHELEVGNSPAVNPEDIG